jgi:DNA-binding PadR family transcriptional regulator
MTIKPLQEPVLLVLTALADAPRHGYALISEIETISGGRVRIKTGTLYLTLDRLQQEGWIEVTKEEVVDGRHRRYYGLTSAGIERLNEAVAQIQATAQEARRRLRVRVSEAHA